MKITNNSKALQGVNAISGVVYLQPGESRDVEVSASEGEHLKTLPFLGLEGVARPPMPLNTETPVNGTEPKPVAEVLAMFSDDDTHFMTAKAEATKILGDKTPATKAEIIAALEELATKPE